MSIIASLVGFAAGFVFWAIGSYLIALFIHWGATRTAPINEKALRAYEIILCGLLFVACIGVFILVAHSLWPEAH